MRKWSSSPNELRDAINAKLDAAIADLPEPDRPFAEKDASYGSTTPDLIGRSVPGMGLDHDHRPANLENPNSGCRRRIDAWSPGDFTRPLQRSGIRGRWVIDTVNEVPDRRSGKFVAEISQRNQSGYGGVLPFQTSVGRFFRA